MANKINVGDFKNVVNADPNEVTFDWEGLSVVVKKTIPLEDMLAFVDSAVDICFTNDGDFHPELIDFAIRSNTLRYYANFKLPADLKQEYFLVTASTAVEWVREYINAEQYEGIVWAIDRKIGYKCRLMESESQRKLSEIISSISEASDKMETMFNGIDPETVSHFVNSLGSGDQITEEGIVRAYADLMREPAEPAPELTVIEGGKPGPEQD